jgi:hypothetical protein
LLLLILLCFYFNFFWFSFWFDFAVFLLTSHHLAGQQITASFPISNSNHPSAAARDILHRFSLSQLLSTIIESTPCFKQPQLTSQQLSQSFIIHHLLNPQTRALALHRAAPFHQPSSTSLPNTPQPHLLQSSHSLATEPPAISHQFNI